MRGLQLIWFQGVASGTYLPIYPVWLVAEEPANHQFVVALDVHQRRAWDGGEGHTELSRAYAARVVYERLHQPLFRVRVLNAYANRCALCGLRHPELLDAAHIRADALGGAPVVPNGIAMCRIHHAAFDALLIGVRPDYVLHVRRELMEEKDGPTLTHALQGLQGQRMTLPESRRARPDVQLLEERCEEFKHAG
jgi:putative restriction endonuclease